MNNKLKRNLQFGLSISTALYLYLHLLLSPKIIRYKHLLRSIYLSEAHDYPSSTISILIFSVGMLTAFFYAKEAFYFFVLKRGKIKEDHSLNFQKKNGTGQDDQS